MDILTALTALQTVESGLTIVTPIAATIRAVYTLPPNRNVALPTTPCWINSWQLTGQEYYMGNQRPEQTYEVSAQLFVLDADTNRGANIATAFHAALVDALAADTTLGGTVSMLSLRGTLAMLDWAGNGYAGLDEKITLTLLN